ncbi:uncharacterized protein PITG_22253 [Phytophthora infestans T30-4]|uniref:Uncharacterized protein n=1 Tax=Phytophthora infestans (strain T30-4) TaxID=403677 RepID=D0RM19_PHYIT|nr:uncharacterized protein PITG_22253 [Phytophthora infestans T30-4]EEY58490.1 hypothetical protein PITG_22253 [Phytophthora infestans T30-4]|eukprot:XP_002909911.1 hypothetical protein PITG_22253 [Phytophthora infestans T30-4]
MARCIPCHRMKKKVVKNTATAFCLADQWRSCSPTPTIVSRTTQVHSPIAFVAWPDGSPLLTRHEPAGRGLSSQSPSIFTSMTVLSTVRIIGSRIANTRMTSQIVILSSGILSEKNLRMIQVPVHGPRSQRLESSPHISQHCSNDVQRT